MAFNDTDVDPVCDAVKPEPPFGMKMTEFDEEEPEEMISERIYPANGLCRPFAIVATLLAQVEVVFGTCDA